MLTITLKGVEDVLPFKKSWDVQPILTTELFDQLGMCSFWLVRRFFSDKFFLLVREQGERHESEGRKARRIDYNRIGSR